MENPGGRGILIAKLLEENYEDNLEFPGGKGCKTKNLPWRKNGYLFNLAVPWKYDRAHGS